MFIIPILWVFLLDILLFFLLYLLYILLLWRHTSRTQGKRYFLEKQTSQLIDDVREELKKLDIHTEGTMMTQKETVTVDGVEYKEEYKRKFKELGEELSLTDIEYNKPTEEHMERALELLIYMTRKSWEAKQFSYFPRATGDPDPTNQVTIDINANYFIDEIQEVFALHVEYGLGMSDLKDRLVDEMVKGNVINLGDKITIVGLGHPDDSPEMYTTGFTPIQSGAGNKTYNVVISYVKNEDLADWKKEVFDNEEKEEFYNEVYGEDK